MRAVQFTILAAIAAAMRLQARAAVVAGEIVDSHSGQPLPARLYIQANDGSWFFPESASPVG